MNGNNMDEDEGTQKPPTSSHSHTTKFSVNTQSSDFAVAESTSKHYERSMHLTKIVKKRVKRIKKKKKNDEPVNEDEQYLLDVDSMGGQILEIEAVALMRETFGFKNQVIDGQTGKNIADGFETLLLQQRNSGLLPRFSDPNQFADALENLARIVRGTDTAGNPSRRENDDNALMDMNDRQEKTVEQQEIVVYELKRQKRKRDKKKKKKKESRAGDLESTPEKKKHRKK